MGLRFTVSGRIARPVHEVFEAVVDPGQLSQFFTTGGAEGRLATGVTVQWDFADFPGRFPVEVAEVVPDQRIVLRWDAAEGATPDGALTTVTVDFAALDDGRTLVSITEEGWSDTGPGRDACIGNSSGWANMLACMKAWLEHGIRLRDGFFA